MEIVLTKREAEEYYHAALCNGGLQDLHNCGISFEYDAEDYKEAKESLKEKIKIEEAKPENERTYPAGISERLGICIEDVWMEMLRIGKTLKFIDEELNGEYSRDVTIEMVHEGVAKTPIHHLMDYINQNDDAITAFVLLQAVMYDGEMIFA